jgi:membrane protease YdiL (CAAX protease family)
LLTALGLNDLEKVSEVIAQEKNNMLEFSLFMVFAVFAEEYFFRSFLIKRFALFFSKFFSKIKKIEKDFVKKASSVSAIIFSTLIFAFAHFGYESVAQIIGAFLLGLILAYWFFKNNSLLQNYLGHLFYNLLVIVIYIVFT